MKGFPVFRQVILSILEFVSLVSLIIAIVLLVNPAANVVVTIIDFNRDGSPNYGPGIASLSSTGAALDLTVSVLTLLVALAGLFFRLLSTAQWEMFLKLVWVELSWIVVMTILWFATALFITIFSATTAIDAAGIKNFEIRCVGSCGASRALKAFAWMNTSLLVGYCIALSGRISVERYKQEAAPAINVDEDLSPNINNIQGTVNEDLEKGLPNTQTYHVPHAVPMHVERLAPTSPEIG